MRSGCVAEAMAVAADVKPLLPPLRFNDLVTGAWMMQRDPARPDSPLGVPVVSELRKVTEPGWFIPHRRPRTASTDPAG